MHLLIVEDDKELVKTILEYFDSYGYMCEVAKSIRSAKEKILDSEYDCVVLDINLPDGKGVDLIPFVKEKTKSPILILSANSSIDDKIAGFDFGADDYLTKPFHLAELNARINSLIRRNQFGGSNLVQFNEIEVNVDKKEVRVCGKKLKLTKKEYELLLFLISNRDKVVTKKSISDHIWGAYIDVVESSNFIYTHLKNLRKKIEENGGKNYVQTVYGIGYRFTDENEAD